MINRLFVLFGICAGIAGASPRFYASGETATRRATGRIAAAFHHTCLVIEDGTVRCWGTNDFGELGDGTVIERHTPVTVSGLTDAISVVAGSQFSCALRGTGSVACWGTNVLNQLFQQSSTPVTINGITAAVSVAAGYSSICAVLVNGSVSCWGFVPGPVAGEGGFQTPTVVSGLSRIVGLAGGLNHYCALRSDGTVWCWGDNDHGQLGNGTTNFSGSPVEVIDARFNGPLRGVSAIYAGWKSTCASHPLLTGETVCWGEDNKDKLSISSQSVDQLNPAFSTSSVKQVAIGEFHACFLFPDGTDSCNGEGSVGELGTGLNVSNGVATAVGDGHSCALLANGSARCWGIDNHGELGDGSPSPISSVPVMVSGISGSVSAMAVSAGYAHTCATRANGTISCWGDNGSGQLGDGTIMDRYVPTAVMGIGNVVATVAGEFHSCALIADGTVQCWGSNNAGQLGDGTFSSHHTPKPVPNLSGVVALAAGRNHTCAVTSDYALLCWGEGNDGEIGDGTHVDRPNPTIVINVNLTGVHNGAALSVAAGDKHTCALLVGGQMKCWGSNPDGRLGDGTDLDRPAPALVQISDATAIAAGSSHTCALRSSGLAQCWGFNLGGQLGDGTQNTRVLPTNVSGLTLAAAIAADGAHTCALIATGGTRCWGDNSDGEVGNGTNAISLLPVDIGVNRGITISAGHDHTCATWDFGALSCWGGNFNGQVGDGTTMDRFRPTSIPSFTLNIVPAVQLIDSRRATVTLLVNCPAEGTFEVAVTLTEGDAQGFGVTAGRCEIGLHTYPLTVRANKSTFSTGTGEVAAQGFTVVEGTRTEQSWTRAVQIQ